MASSSALHARTAAECRDDETGDHTQRVGELAARLAMRLRLWVYRVELIRPATPLHDVCQASFPGRPQ
ncbi:MAG TPA: hypothetical protein VJ840_18375 [Gemmatimonadaceae bacterium]|nr:hypothetical protein [Gemmatimonadaceae bacterium]